MLAWSAAMSMKAGQEGMCPPGPLELRHLRGVRVTQMRSQRGRFPPCRSSCGVCARVRDTAVHRGGAVPPLPHEMRRCELRMC